MWGWKKWHKLQIETRPKLDFPDLLIQARNHEVKLNEWDIPSHACPNADLHWNHRTSYWPWGDGGTTGGAKPPCFTSGQRNRYKKQNARCPRSLATNFQFPLHAWTPNHVSSRLSALRNFHVPTGHTVVLQVHAVLRQERLAHPKTLEGGLLLSGQARKIICRLLVIRKGLRLLIFKQPAWSCRVILIILMRSTQNPMPQFMYL